MIFSSNATRRSLLAAAAAAFSACMAGCAGPSAEAPSATAQQVVREPVETQTGSNIPRRANKPSNVIVVDPDAIQGAARGATRNPGGPPN